MTQLEAFRQEVWDEKQDELGFLLPVALLPDSHIKNLLNNFAHLKSSDTELCHTFASMPQPSHKKPTRVVPTTNPNVGLLPAYIHFHSLILTNLFYRHTPVPSASTSMTGQFLLPDLTVSCALPTYDTFWSQFIP
jgi:hypothetical protein